MRCEEYSYMVLLEGTYTDVYDSKVNKSSESPFSGKTTTEKAKYLPRYIGGKVNKMSTTGKIGVGAGAAAAGMAGIAGARKLLKDRKNKKNGPPVSSRDGKKRVMESVNNLLGILLEGDPKQMSFNLGEPKRPQDEFKFGDIKRYAEKQIGRMKGRVSDMGTGGKLGVGAGLAVGGAAAGYGLKRAFGKKKEDVARGGKKRVMEAVDNLLGIMLEANGEVNTSQMDRLNKSKDKVGNLKNKQEDLKNSMSSDKPAPSTKPARQKSGAKKGVAKPAKSAATTPAAQPAPAAAQPAKPDGFFKGLSKSVGEMSTGKKIGLGAGIGAGTMAAGYGAKRLFDRNYKKVRESALMMEAEAYRRMNDEGINSQFAKRGGRSGGSVENVPGQPKPVSTPPQPNAMKELQAKRTAATRGAAQAGPPTAGGFDKMSKGAGGLLSRAKSMSTMGKVGVGLGAAAAGGYGLKKAFGKGDQQPPQPMRRRPR